MQINSLPGLYSNGLPLSIEPDNFGELRDSSHLLGNGEELRRQIDEDGYLYIKGFFPRELVMEARRAMTDKLNQVGLIEPNTDPIEGNLRAGADVGFLPGIARDDVSVQRIVFGPEIHEFYATMLNSENIRHFDFIWVRAMGHGQGTPPHCDVVYMGRGTHNLYTAWIPYGDVPYDLGGLMILEGSLQQADRIRNYLESDVDTFCENNPERHGWVHGGALTKNPVSLQEKFGGRWLTTEFQMGDLLTFRIDTIHASTDNQTRRVRLSTDTRYQRASEAVDERWIGANPIGHSQAGKRGRIC